MDRLWAFRYKEDSSLSHHGIEGQKWGVRNGPPYPLNSKALASSVFNNANRRINKISSDVTSSAKVSGSKMYGLEHKLKTKESIQRKIETDAKEKGISKRKAADSIRDAVRFTTISDTDNFVSSYERFKEQMADKGYTEIRCKNYFEQFKEGKVKHVGISFHDNAETLDMILSEHPEIEVVQIQFNYVDYDDASVQSKKLLDVCVKHGKPVIVMEPVKGGSLVNVPDKTKDVFAALGGSPASYAIRFAASFDGVFMVLSGMSNMEMMMENVGFMSDFKKLDESEMAAIDEVREIFRNQDVIPCTACQYCTEKCPKNIPIPSIFSCLNENNTFKNWNAGYYYSVHTEKGGKASECIECGLCESVCPQHLKVRDLLKDAVQAFEKK